MTTAIIVIACLIVGALVLAGFTSKHPANRPPNSDDADEVYFPPENK